MINENTTFKQYLKESGYSLMQYQEEVYHTCLAKSSKYKNIDLYFQDEIEQGFNDNAPIEDTANTICEKFDDFFDKTNVEEDEEYTPEQLQAFADYPQDSFDEDVNESTETETKDDGMSDGESYTQWKENVFKYLDKRIETDKIKELGTYIKDFIKQEYDNGEPSWFNVAESVVNYARTNYPQAVKPRESNAFSITENKIDEARLSNKIKALAELEEYFGVSANGDTIYTDGITRPDEIEIGNICAKYNVDFALGSKHVTVYAKSRNEAFIQDDRGNVSITDLVDKIMNKAGMVVDMDDDYTAAAYYIADFYSKQSMPINGMVMWGSRDLLKFKRIYDGQIQNANTSEEIQEYEKKAVTNVRSIMLGNPGKKWTWIEEIKDEVRKERKDAEEKRRQAYLNSEEHRHMQDPGWRGPNGTWSND